MSSNMFAGPPFWSSNNKPQRRLGRRSLALSTNTTNTTINGTLNNTARFGSEFPSKRSNNEPSCASTPLPDSKNKENIFLSSIKPVLASSPKSARKVPYQRRLGRRSMAAPKTTSSEESALNDSVNRMRSINSTLKLTDTSKATVTQPQSSTGGLGFLNLERLDFWRKYLPSSVPAVIVQPPSPPKSFVDNLVRSPAKVSETEEVHSGSTTLKSPVQPKLDCDTILRRIQASSHVNTGPKYEPLLRHMEPKYESIIEDSESPTITIEAAEKAGAEKDDTNGGSESAKEDSLTEETFLKKSLNGTQVHMTKSVDEGSHYGSFLGDTVTEGQEKMDTVMEEQENVEENKTHTGEDLKGTELLKPEEELDLNRTFELPEEESLLFKTPLAPKFLNQSNVTHKTPRSSVFKRFQMNDDANDSFIENERTIMLQFKVEQSEPSVTTNAGNRNTSETIPLSDTTKIVCDTTSDVTSTGKTLFQDLIDEKLRAFISEQNRQLETFISEQSKQQKKQLETFISEQFKQMQAFTESQNTAVRNFMGTIAEAYVAQVGTTKVPEKSEISNSGLSTSALGNVQNNVTGPTCKAVDSTVNKNESAVRCKTPKRNLNIPSPVIKTRSSSRIRQSFSNLNQTKMSTTILDDDDTTTFRAKPRQSIAFSNFKKNCSILKTPSRTRSSFANSSAVMTPGMLSTCVRDQLEALEES